MHKLKRLGPGGKPVAIDSSPPPVKASPVDDMVAKVRQGAIAAGAPEWEALPGNIQLATWIKLAEQGDFTPDATPALKSIARQVINDNGLLANICEQSKASAFLWDHVDSVGKARLFQDREKVWVTHLDAKRKWEWVKMLSDGDVLSATIADNAERFFIGLSMDAMPADVSEAARTLLAKKVPDSRLTTVLLHLGLERVTAADVESYPPERRELFVSLLATSPDKGKAWCHDLEEGAVSGLLALESRGLTRSTPSPRESSPLGGTDPVRSFVFEHIDWFSFAVQKMLIESHLSEIPDSIVASWPASSLRDCAKALVESGRHQSVLLSILANGGDKAGGARATLRVPTRRDSDQLKKGVDGGSLRRTGGGSSRGVPTPYAPSSGPMPTHVREKVNLLFDEWPEGLEGVLKYIFVLDEVKRGGLTPARTRLVDALSLKDRSKALAGRDGRTMAERKYLLLGAEATVAKLDADGRRILQQNLERFMHQWGTDGITVFEQNVFGLYRDSQITYGELVDLLDLVGGAVRDKLVELDALSTRERALVILAPYLDPDHVNTTDPLLSQAMQTFNSAVVFDQLSSSMQRFCEASGHRLTLNDQQLLEGKGWQISVHDINAMDELSIRVLVPKPLRGLEVDTLRGLLVDTLRGSLAVHTTVWQQTVSPAIDRQRLCMLRAAPADLVQALCTEDQWNSFRDLVPLYNFVFAGGGKMWRVRLNSFSDRTYHKPDKQDVVRTHWSATHVFSDIMHGHGPSVDIDAAAGDKYSLVNLLTGAGDRLQSFPEVVVALDRISCLLDGDMKGHSFKAVFGEIVQWMRSKEIGIDPVAMPVFGSFIASIYGQLMTEAVTDWFRADSSSGHTSDDD